MVLKVVAVCVVSAVAMMLQSPVVAAATDTCALLTAAQATAALGGTVGGGKPFPGQACQWEQQGKGGDVLLKLNINVVTAARYERMKSVTVGTVTSVSGLGDDAYYSTLKTANDVITTLNVKKGDNAVVIRVFGGKKPADEYQAKEKAVAQTIVAKL
jgi:hypothetical protein